MTAQRSSRAQPRDLFWNSAVIPTQPLALSAVEGEREGSIRQQQEDGRRKTEGAGHSACPLSLPWRDRRTSAGQTSGTTLEVQGQTTTAPRETRCSR